MQNGWYDSTNPIWGLDLIWCEFNSIEEGAFSGIAFEKLKRLFMTDIYYVLPPVHWHGDIFHGLLEMEYLYFEYFDIVRIPVNALSTTRRFLYAFRLLRAPANLNFDDLFGRRADRLSNLRLINVTFTLPVAPRILTQSNFSALASIRMLSLTDCGISTIEANTFAQIAYTLVHLDLSQNDLTTVPATVFNSIIDMDRGHDYLWSPIALDGNSFDCDCAIYEIDGRLTLMSHVLKQNYTQIECAGRSMERRLLCPHLQTIQATSAWNTSLSNIAHPKFIIKIDVKRRQLRIQAGVKDAYRLWIQMDNYLKLGRLGKQLKCVHAKSMLLDTQCMRFTGDVERLPVNRFLIEQNITRFCISYVAMNKKTFWPLNCVSIYWPEMDNAFMRLDVAVLLSMILNAIGLIAMIVLIVWIKTPRVEFVQR